MDLDLSFYNWALFTSYLQKGLIFSVQLTVIATVGGIIVGRGNQYTIWIDEMGQDESIKVLSHELIHLEQYRNREIVLEEYYIVWRGINYTYGDIERMDYLKRPWEIDAINKSKKLRDSMEGILYGR